jgi:hypothetical protein
MLKKATELYDAKVKLTKELENKNHDYGEVWREMREFLLI